MSYTYKRIEKVCACGCGRTFYPVRTYVPAPDGTRGPRYPDYIRGHHPNNQKNAEKLAGWNRGMKKGDHPSLQRMGYQPGHKPHNDWSKINERLKTDPAFKAAWIEAKRGKPAWNKGAVDSPVVILKRMLRSIYERDGFRCVECRKVGTQRNGKWNLVCHHIVPIKIDPSLIIEPSNLITLCHSCHHLAHNGKLPHLIQTD